MLVDYSCRGKRIASVRQARAAGVVDRPATLQDFLLGPVIVLDIYLVARAPGRFLQRIIDQLSLSVPVSLYLSWAYTLVQ